MDGRNQQQQGGMTAADLCITPGRSCTKCQQLLRVGGADRGGCNLGERRDQGLKGPCDNCRLFGGDCACAPSKVCDTQSVSNKVFKDSRNNNVRGDGYKLAVPVPKDPSKIMSAAKLAELMAKDGAAVGEVWQTGPGDSSKAPFWDEDFRKKPSGWRAYGSRANDNSNRSNNNNRSINNNNNKRKMPWTPDSNLASTTRPQDNVHLGPGVQRTVSLSQTIGDIEYNVSLTMKNTSSSTPASYDASLVSKTLEGVLSPDPVRIHHKMQKKRMHGAADEHPSVSQRAAEGQVRKASFVTVPIRDAGPDANPTSAETAASTASTDLGAPLANQTGEDDAEPAAKRRQIDLSATRRSAEEIGDILTVAGRKRKREA